MVSREQEWFYDELAMEEMDTIEEPEAESDEDYFHDTYANRRRRRGGAAPTGPGSRGGRARKSQPDDTPAKRGRAVRTLTLFHTIQKIQCSSLQVSMYT
jgi:hypothetical protein